MRRLISSRLALGGQVARVAPFFGSTPRLPVMTILISGQPATRSALRIPHAVLSLHADDHRLHRRVAVRRGNVPTDRRPGRPRGLCAGDGRQRGPTALAPFQVFHPLAVERLAQRRIQVAFRQVQLTCRRLVIDSTVA